MAGLTVLDASILLAHLDDTDPHVGAARAQRLDEQLSDLAGLQIQAVAIEQGAAAQLARLRAETGLRMPECCVLHAAAQTNADALGTRDERLARVAATRGLQTP